MPHQKKLRLHEVLQIKEKEMKMSSLCYNCYNLTSQQTAATVSNTEQVIDLLA